MATSNPGQQSDVLTPPPQYSVHEKQRELLASDARYRVAKWGRRGGKNVVSAIDLEERGRDPSASQWGSDDPENTVIWFVGPSYDQAYRYGFEPLKNALPNSWIDGKPIESEPYEITLVNGVQYEFRTFDYPKTLQGAGVDHVVIDEADYMPDSLWYNDIEPMLMDTMGSALLISKPVRPRSYFQRYFDLGQSSDHPDYYSSHATSADNPFIAEDPMDKRGSVPNHVFQQEYLAQLPDDGGEVFKKLGDRLFTETYQLEGDVVEGIGEAKRPVDDCTPPFAVGVDFARHQDYRVTTVLDAAGEIAYFSRDQNEGWDTIQDDIEDVHAEYPGIVLPDASRDNKIVADLASEGVTLDPVGMSPKTKKSLIDDLATRIENEELTAPSVPELDQLRLELRQLERDVTETGYTRYHAPETGHDDCVDSLALAASALDRIAAAARRHEKRADEDDDSTGVSYL